MEKHTHHPPRRSPNTHKRPPTKSVRQRRLLSSPLLVRETRGASPAAVRTRRAPPPSSLPPSLPRAALTSGGRDRPGGRLCAGSGQRRRGGARHTSTFSEGLSLPCRAEPSRAASASPGTPPRPPLAAASPRCGAQGRDAERREAMRSRPQPPGRPGAALPAPPRPARYLPGQPGGTERFRRQPAPPSPSCIPVPPFAALTCRARSGARRGGLLLFRALTGFVRPSPSVNCSKEEVREGCVSGSSLHGLQQRPA